MATDPALRRDAILIASLERPFTRWRELTGNEQDAYIKKARRVREHLKTYEPLSQL